MKMLTLQEIFNGTLEKLNAQGRKRSSDGDTCLYRGPDGLKCAVGLWIPDDKYNPAWEKNGITDLIHHREDFREVMKGIGIDADNHEVVDLLGSLQSFHDNYVDRGYGWQFQQATLHNWAVYHGIVFDVDKQWPRPLNEED